MLTAKGKPIGILLGVEADNLEEMAQAIRQAKAQRALSRMRREAARRGLNRLPPSDIDALLDYIEMTGEPVTGLRLPIVLPDPRDLPFLEVAAAGRADAVITGNTRHFKPQRGHHGVKICTPAEFVRSLPPDIVT